MNDTLDPLCLRPELGFALDVTAMNLPPDTLAAKRALITKALDGMSALEGGAIANPDENRRVGHYWLRDSSRAPADLKERIDSIRAKITEFTGQVHGGTVKPPTASAFTNVLLVGIGGSALGPQFVSAALTKGPKTDRAKMFFFDNTDPDGMDRTLAQIIATKGGLAETLTVVISKSGGTKETRNGMLEAKRAYEAAGLAFAKHAVAVTGDDSELDKVANGEGWITTFPMDDWIGGRTSELSAVGLLPAALQGIDMDAMLAGAAAMDEATRDRDPNRNPAMMLALSWWHATGGTGAKDMVVLPYKDRLELFSRYLQQLVMESLGKAKDLDGNTVHQGIAVYGNKGSTDQHAYVQQLRDGVANFFVTFIEVLRDRDGAAFEVEPGVTSGDYLFGFLEGTRRALSEGGRPSLTITIDHVDARAVGMLIALYERAVGYYGNFANINAYHQPGVEAGKKAAADVLALMKKVVSRVNETGGTAAEIAKGIGTEDVATVWRILRHLSANPVKGLKATGEGMGARFER